MVKIYFFFLMHDFHWTASKPNFVLVSGLSPPLAPHNNQYNREDNCIEQVINPMFLYLVTFAFVRVNVLRLKLVLWRYSFDAYKWDKKFLLPFIKFLFICIKNFLLQRKSSPFYIWNIKSSKKYFYKTWALLKKYYVNFMYVDGTHGS